MQILALTIFWVIGILWAMYYWYADTSRNQDGNSNAPKVIFDLHSDKKHSASSIESLDYSDTEGTIRKNMQNLKHKIKTRWPSKVNMSINARSFK